MSIVPGNETGQSHLVNSLSRDRQIPASCGWINANEGDLAIPCERMGQISVDHETLVVDCQIRHFPLDLAIQREQIVIY
jgi:hypothetical protein